MEQSEQLLRQAANNPKLGQARCDEIDQCYICVSEEYAHIFGYTVKEFLERFRHLERDMELVHPEDREMLDTYYETTRSGWTALEYRILHRDGSVRHVREIIQQIVDEKGKLLESTSTLQDISDSDRA